MIEFFRKGWIFIFFDQGMDEIFYKDICILDNKICFSESTENKFFKKVADFLF